MGKSTYLADVAQGVVAFCTGSVCALALHTRWYYGGWISWFGDPPASNPAYERFAELFTIIPYVAGGAAVGIVSGFGYIEPMRIAIRFGAVIACFLVALSSTERLAVHGFVPAALVSFFLSAGTSFLYFQILDPEQKKLGKRMEI